MSMSVAEARAEIKGLYEKADEIERRYPDGPITSAEDEAEVKRLLSEIDGLEDKLAGIEEAEGRKGRILEGLDKYARPAQQMRHVEPPENREPVTVDPGLQFISDPGFKHLLRTGAFNSKLNRVEFAVQLKDGTSLIDFSRKSLVYSADAVGGGLVANDRRPGILELLQREIMLLDMVPRVGTDSDTVEYVREDTFTNNAAFTAEATATTGTSGTKPESALAYSAQTAAVRTLAHWIPVTNRMLSDAPAIRGIINSRLLLGLQLILEAQMLTGDGNGENFTGILNTAGVNIQAAGTDSVLDRIYKGRTQVRVTGRARPTAVVLHPNDFQDIRLARENVATATLGQYLMGPPSVTGATTVWGIPVVETDAETENTALVGDFAMGATLFDREQAAIRVGTIDDQFVRNMQTILAELRAAFVVWRPTAFCRVTGV